jgi:hypothetical protein
MTIQGIDGRSKEQLQFEIQNGGKFVFFQFCISAVIITFKRSSDVYFVPPGHSAAAKGLGFTLLSAVLGWWGIPWGPIYTVQSIYVNSRGGRDVTAAVMSSMG